MKTPAARTPAPIRVPTLLVTFSTKKTGDGINLTAHILNYSEGKKHSQLTKVH